LSSGLSSSTELFEAVVTRPLNSLTLLVQPEGSLVKMLSQVTGLTTSSSLSETGGAAEIHNHSKS
jgi:hypothetical protein